MSTTSILSVIQYYQRSIEKYQTDEARLLHCVSKLYNLPVKVEHLQETGIGKTVNSLRKFEGEIGSAAKALVAKWKAMVAAEEEPMDTNCNQNETNNSNGNGDDTDDENHNDQNRNSVKIECDEPNQHQAKERGHSEVKNKSKEKGHHSRHSSSNSHHKSSSSNTHTESSSSMKHKSKSSHSTSSSSTEKKKSHSDAHHKSRGKDDEKKEHKSEKLKEKEVEDRKKEDKPKSSSSSRYKDSSSSNKKEQSNSSEEHHSKKSKSSPEPQKESSHRHSSHSKGHKDHEKRSSSASKEKERKIQKDAERTNEKHKSTSKEHEHSHDKKKHTSSSKPTSSSSSSAHKTKDTVSTPTDLTVAPSSSSSAERKRRRHSSEHDSSNESVAIKSKAVKQSKPAVSEEHDNDEEDFIDSSMGANFADVLGMLNKPSKKSKKLSSALKSPNTSVKASSSTNAKNISSSSKETQHKSSSSSSSKMNGVRSSTSSSVASTSRKSDMKPDLLSSSTKLEPLDPSIVLELPSISTNYKPMPLNQTVMDCVFASSSSSSYSNAPKAPVRTLTDAEALQHGISSKTMRTKIYSGVRTGQLLHAPSLFDLCIRVLQKNIDALEYTGGVPFEVLRPVLDRATPQQLLIFEEYNPYLMEDSDALWQQHVSRHYRAQKRKEMESWREMFLRCQEDQERKLNILAESIKQSQKIIAAPVRKTQLAFVDSMVKPPRNVQRKQEQYGTKSKLIATPAARVASLSSVTPNAAKTGDARLRVAATVRDHAQVSNAIRPKKAPLMAKTLQLMRGRQKR